MAAGATRQAAVVSRRTKGAGGVFPVRDGVWRVDVEISRDPVTGRRRRVSRTVRGTRRDAEVALAKLRLADHERRLPSVGTSGWTVRVALDLYVRTIEQGLIEMAPRGLLTVRSAANTVSAVELPDGRTFGAVSLSTLSWQDVEHLYHAMRRAGRSAAWIRRCATVVTQAFELARKRGLLDSNPAKDAARPRTVRIKPVAPSQQEMRALLEVVRAKDQEMGRALLLLASTGMRKGELLALQFRDVNWGDASVHVAYSITDGGPGVGVLRKETKRADWRDVPLTDAAVGAIRGQWEVQREVAGEEPPAASFVFSPVGDGGVPYRPDSFSARWVAARGTSTVTLQQVRHYAATRMLDAGESFRTVADILGNSENTLRLHYDGRVDVGKRRAISALEL